MGIVYPFDSPKVSVALLLSQPALQSRALTALTSQRFVADRIFAAGTPEQVAGGSARYQRSESIFTDQDAEEIVPRGEYPRAQWSEQVMTALVRKYGLEVPIADESVERNEMDVVERGFRKLANTIIRFVDGRAMNLLGTDPDVLAHVGTQWTGAAANVIIRDIATARKLIDDQDEGYEADTLIVSGDQALDLIIDPDIRNAFPREGDNQFISGEALPMLGLRQILRTNRLASGTAYVLSMGMIGTIADEVPSPQFGWRGMDTEGGPNRQVYVKNYRGEGADETIIKGVRRPAMWVAEPKAAVRITGI